MRRALVISNWVSKVFAKIAGHRNNWGNKSGDSGLPQGAPPGVGYNRVKSRSLGPLVKVPVDEMFTRSFSTRSIVSICCLNHT